MGGKGCRRINIFLTRCENARAGELEDVAGAYAAAVYGATSCAAGADHLEGACSHPLWRRHRCRSRVRTLSINLSLLCSSTQWLASRGALCETSIILPQCQVSDLTKTSMRHPLCAQSSQQPLSQIR